MSGGSYDYFYLRLEEIAYEMANRRRTPARAAFRDHLLKVAKAMHDIEWVDSSDYGPGDEDEAIRAALHPGAELEAATTAARAALKDLQDVLGR